MWVFFVDERNVEHSSDDSNFKGAQEALLGRVPIPAAQVRVGFPAAAGDLLQLRSAVIH